LQQQQQRAAAAAAAEAAAVANFFSEAAVLGVGRLAAATVGLYVN